MSEKIGEGAHGAVWSVGNGTVSKRSKIVKRVGSGIYLSDGGIPELVALERLARNGCRHVVRVRGWRVSGRAGELSTIDLEELSPLSAIGRERITRNARRYVRHLFEALADMHAADVVHGDIKLDNIMYRESTDEIVIIDFGLSKVDRCVKMRDDDTDALFTFDYRPPEVLLRCSKIGIAKADVWAAGVCALSMLMGRTRRSVFDVEDDPEVEWDELMDDIVDWMGSSDLSDEDCWPEEMRSKRYFEYSSIESEGTLRPYMEKRYGADAADFFAAVLRINPRKRCGAARALEMPYVSCQDPTPVEVPYRPFGRIPAYGTVSRAVAMEVRSLCKWSGFCWETCYKALDLLAATGCGEDMDPAKIAAAVVIATAVAESLLVQISRVFGKVAPWLDASGVRYEVCSLLATPGVVPVLGDQSVLRVAKALGKVDRRVNDRLFDMYISGGGKRPTEAGIKEIVILDSYTSKPSSWW